MCIYSENKRFIHRKLSMLLLQTQSVSFFRWLTDCMFSVLQKATWLDRPRVPLQTGPTGSLLWGGCRAAPKLSTEGICFTDGFPNATLVKDGLMKLPHLNLQSCFWSSQVPTQLFLFAFKSWARPLGVQVSSLSSTTYYINADNLLGTPCQN